MPSDSFRFARGNTLPRDFKSISKTNTLTRKRQRRELLSCRLLGFALNIDLAFQVGAFLDRNPLRGNIAGNHGGFAQFDAVAGLHVALKFALAPQFPWPPPRP